MTKFRQAYNTNYDKRNPKQYSDKGYRALIIGLAVGAVAGSTVTAFLLIGYSIFFR